MRTICLIPVQVETVPSELEEGILYISKQFGVAIHLCCCGCKGKTVMDLKPHWKDGWEMTEFPDGSVSFTPSIGNFAGENPYHAHYFIVNNYIVWC